MGRKTLTQSVDSFMLALSDINYSKFCRSSLSASYVGQSLSKGLCGQDIMSFYGCCQLIMLVIMVMRFHVTDMHVINLCLQSHILF